MVHLNRMHTATKSGKIDISLEVKTAELAKKFSFILKKSESNPFPAAIEWLDYSNKVGIMRSKKLDTYCAKNGFGTPHMSCSSNLIEKVGDIFKFRLEFTDWRYTEYPGGSISQVVSLDLKNYTYVFDGIASGRCYDRSPDTIRAWAN